MELKELGQLLKEHSESNKGFQIHLNSGNIDTLCGKSIDVEFSDLYFTNCKMLRDKHTLVFCNDDKQPVGFDDEINACVNAKKMYHEVRSVNYKFTACNCYENNSY